MLTRVRGGKHRADPRARFRQDIPHHALTVVEGPLHLDWDHPLTVGASPNGRLLDLPELDRAQSIFGEEHDGLDSLQATYGMRDRPAGVPGGGHQDDHRAFVRVPQDRE